MFVFISVWCHYVLRTRALVVRRFSKSTDLMWFDADKWKRKQQAAYPCHASRLSGYRYTAHYAIIGPRPGPLLARVASVVMTNEQWLTDTCQVWSVAPAECWSLFYTWQLSQSQEWKRWVFKALVFLWFKKNKKSRKVGFFVFMFFRYCCFFK